MQVSVNAAAQSSAVWSQVAGDEALKQQARSALPGGTLACVGLAVQQLLMAPSGISDRSKLALLRVCSSLQAENGTLSASSPEGSVSRLTS